MRLLSFLLLGLLCLPTTADQLSIERIYGDPDLSGAAPNGVKFSPDGERVTFLRGKDSDFEVLDLWEYHFPSGQTRLLVDSAALADVNAEMSDAEKARRERLRLSSRGITSYFWSDDGQALLFPLAGDVFYFRLGDAKPRQLTATDAFETDARISPKGNYVSFVRDQDLYVLHIASGRETRLTRDGGGVISNGMAEFVAQEEMYRFTGYWWAPDESRLAYTRVDESTVEVIKRSEIYADRIEIIEQRYPLTGTRNAEVKLGVIPVEGGETRWLGTFGPDEGYLPRVRWLRDSRYLSHQWQSRDQQILHLMVSDLETGEQWRLLTENSDTWINLAGSRSGNPYQGLYFLKDNRHFLWASERDGFNHLYLYRNSGEQVRRLTEGEWVVGGIVAVDESAGVVYLTGNKDDLRQRQLYRVSLDGKGDVQRVTQRDGWHSIAFAADGSGYVDTWSDDVTPPQVSLHRASGERLAWLEHNAMDKTHPLHPFMSDWIKPEYGTLAADDGTELHYRILKGQGTSASKPGPAIVFLYAGPGPQMVADTWGGRRSLYLQYLAQQGYTVFTLDNRGSANRGKEFEEVIYRHLSDVELADQVTGARFLGSLPYVDAQRIGVHGHSYGGYMTLMAMFRAPEVFAAGVAGAPVTLWELYDTAYTERYMSTPQDNPAGYRDSSVFPHIDGLKGDLLIYHGMADDNVLFSHSTRLYKALQDAALPFEVMDYPGKKHSIRGKQTGIHLRHTITRFFDRHLKDN